jgi:RNA polymerase sigma factor (sigma-70 family)
MTPMQKLRNSRCRSRFKTWIYGIGIHKCADYLRVRASDMRRQKVVQENLWQTLDERRIDELRQTIQEALTSVPDEQREVLELFYRDGLTIADIARVLNRNLSTVKYQFFCGHACVVSAIQGLAGSADLNKIQP